MQVKVVDENVNRVKVHIKVYVHIYMYIDLCNWYVTIN